MRRKGIEVGVLKVWKHMACVDGEDLRVIEAKFRGRLKMAGSSCALWRASKGSWVSRDLVRKVSEEKKGAG